jgi:hypothetical protein
MEPRESPSPNDSFHRILKDCRVLSRYNGINLWAAWPTRFRSAMSLVSFSQYNQTLPLRFASSLCYRQTMPKRMADEELSIQIQWNNISRHENHLLLQYVMKADGTR